ncbi:MAG TPA: hypothetical protein DCQ79_10200 [Rhizobiales bacterium]|nr:hypothetical protein [Hyphomicrobiales bacterium]
MRLAQEVRSRKSAAESPLHKRRGDIDATRVPTPLPSWERVAWTFRSQAGGGGVRESNMKQLTVGGVEIAYLDEGKGPAVVIGHCSSASHREWLPLIETLRSDWRVLAPDFIGYGRSDPWPAEEPFSTDADVNVLLAVAKKTKGPLHLVGHSYGAALALEAARTLGRRVKSLTLVEPVTFQLLRQEGRPEWAEVEQLGLAVLGPVAKGEDRAAAAAFMSYWLGRWRWWLSPETPRSKA